MDKIYTFNKKEFLIKQISKIEFHFTNGDFLKLNRMELVEKSLKLCDKLQRVGEGYCFFVKEAFFKFKIFSKRPKNYDAEYLVGKKQFLKDRKSYIENRCINDQDLCNIQFYDRNNWNIDLLSNYIAEMDGEYLIIKSEYKGDCDSENGSIYLNDIKKDDICIMTLDFENCEMFDVYNDEILELKIDYNEELSWGSDKLYREIKSGYLRIKLSKKDRYVNSCFQKHYTIKQLERRICGKKGYCEHDICHLCINSPGFLGKETIEISDIRSNDELTKISKLEENTSEWIAPYFVGGYAKKLKDASICISFGKNARETINKFC